MVSRAAVLAGVLGRNRTNRPDRPRDREGICGEGWLTGSGRLRSPRGQDGATEAGRWGGSQPEDPRSWALLSPRGEGR